MDLEINKEREKPKVLKPKFELGFVCTTIGIAEGMKQDAQFKKEVNDAFSRYTQADWSDMKYEEDRQQNERAVREGDDRIFATYDTSRGTIYIITEYDRTCTTILFPDEY